MEMRWGTKGCRRNASTAKERQGQGISCWGCVGPGSAGVLGGDGVILIWMANTREMWLCWQNPKAKARKRSAKTANKLCWDGSALA